MVLSLLPFFSIVGSIRSHDNPVSFSERFGLSFFHPTKKGLSPHVVRKALISCLHSFHSRNPESTEIFSFIFLLLVSRSFAYRPLPGQRKERSFLFQ